ncbi:MAG: cupin domain-containing protein [Acidimicrobiia bacterium]
MSVRRVVTGVDDSGRSVFVDDEQVEPITVGLMPGLEFQPLWGSDQPVVLPTDGTPADAPAYFPPAGGFRFGLVSIPPEGERREGPAPGNPGPEASPTMEEVERKLPGLLGHMEPDHPGMHTTDTVDFDVVLSGDIYLELDDGAEVHLQTGDCIVQNGTRHGWHNRASQPCVLAVTTIGASRGVPEA